MLLPRLGGLPGALTGAAGCTSPVMLAAYSSSVLRSSRSDICAVICVDAWLATWLEIRLSAMIPYPYSGFRG